ncbi:hypothetical protein Q669_29610 [Labrenzia sp. C1B10]|uniref:hypothetical protein n=1 Tax=unclassified Labrenzia TaxID=2648686 RepID=UPI0003B83A3B|nr:MULTISPECIES: hypothetical protein [unclassified Labrenzia]ERP95728.1 hypothetical protein Q669_29610 [Labrenzia sp. C1B10]ERS05794.1 hypothetical protein Q675_29175 [Labrenzia sp. C1B70]
MPEFVMEGILEPDFQSLDSFTQGYIQALFFTETEPGTDADSHDPESQSSLPGDCGFDDFAAETLDAIKRDCAEFQKRHAPLLAKAYETRDTYTEEQAGMDFWLNRNGHGAGFWDRGLGEIGDALSNACDWRGAFGNRDVYLGDDGKVYF